MADPNATPLTRRFQTWRALNPGVSFSVMAALVNDAGGSVSPQGVWQWSSGHKRPGRRNRAALAVIFGDCTEADLLLMSRGYEPRRETSS